jgi:hypothetical protein
MEFFCFLRIFRRDRVCLYRYRYRNGCRYCVCIPPFGAVVRLHVCLAACERPARLLFGDHIRLHPRLLPAPTAATTDHDAATTAATTGQWNRLALSNRLTDAPLVAIVVVLLLHLLLVVSYAVVNSFDHVGVPISEKLGVSRLSVLVSAGRPVVSVQRRVGPNAPPYTIFLFLVLGAGYLASTFTGLLILVATRRPPRSKTSLPLPEPLPTSSSLSSLLSLNDLNHQLQMNLRQELLLDFRASRAFDFDRDGFARMQLYKLMERGVVYGAVNR